MRQGRDTQRGEPGWWLASDGRWYPPEASPGHADGRSRPRRGRLAKAWKVTLVVVAVLGVTVLIGGVVYVGRHHDQMTRVRRVSQALTTPASWTFTGRYEDPDSGPFCMISCPRLTITIIFRDGSSAAAACETIRAQIERQVAPTHADPSASCGWRASVPGAGSRASVSAGTMSATELLPSPRPFPWLHSVSPSDQATHAAPHFSGVPTHSTRRHPPTPT